MARSITRMHCQVGCGHSSACAPWLCIVSLVSHACIVSLVSHACIDTAGVSTLSRSCWSSRPQQIQFGVLTIYPTRCGR